MTDKICSACGLAKNKLAKFSVRQQSKKFGRCNKCLEPTHVSQNYTPSLADDRCKSCQDLLTAANKSMTDNSICGMCAARQDSRKFAREFKASRDRQVEEKALAKKYKQKKIIEKSEEMLWDVVKDGIDVAFENDKILFRADD